VKGGDGLGLGFSAYVHAYLWRYGRMGIPWEHEKASHHNVRIENTGLSNVYVDMGDLIWSGHKLQILGQPEQPVLTKYAR